MNQSGTYLIQDGLLVKVSDDIPRLQKPVYFNLGNVPQWDAGARVTFQSRQHKRRWLIENRMAEGGIVNPNKRLEGTEGCMYKRRSR